MIDRTPRTAKGRRIKRVCVVCNAPFLIVAHHAERYTTCSRECSSERRRRARQIHPSEITCEKCGKVVKRTTHKQRFCSNICRLAALNELPRERMVGFHSAHVTPRGYVRGQIWRDGQKVSIMEHRYVMEQHLGRQLTSVERVHHKNGDRADNRIKNLELFASQADHIKHSHPEIVAKLRGR